MNHIDIRNYGSGNSGTTNALRVLGKKAGLIVFLGDFFKMVLACFLVRLVLGSDPNTDLYVLYTGLGVVLGHNFPCYLKFHGGKGISATAGLFLSLDPLLTLGALILFAGSVGLTRYVSLGSILVSIWLPVGVVLYGVTGRWGLAQGHLYEMYAIAVFLCAMALFRHRKNIHGLLTGTERKLGEKAE